MRYVLCFVLGMYSGLFIVLAVTGIDIHLAKLERRRNLKRHDYDEACRLRGIKEGTWQ